MTNIFARAARVRPNPPAASFTPAAPGRAAPPAQGLGTLPDRVKKMLQGWLAIASTSDAIEQFPSAFQSLPRPTRAFRPAGITPAAALGVGTTQAAVPVKWPQSCYVVGITFGTIEGTPAALNAMSVRIQVEGTLDIFTDGNSGAFLHVGSLGSSQGIGQGAYYPFIRWADQSTTWQVTVKNEAPGGGATITPVVQFLIVDPRDVPELFQAQE